jgi:urease accessory protein
MKRYSTRSAGSVLAWLAAVLVCTPALQAHSAPGAPSDALAGFLHPLTGLDHLLVMLAVGAWAARLGGRATWLLPLTFIACMAAGGGLAALGASLPGVEWVILSSVVVLGLCVARSSNAAPGAAAVLAGAFALFHGHAHATEMPAGAAAMTYAAGMLIATTFLHAAGALLVVATARRPSADRALRFGGAVTAACGMLLALSLVWRSVG